MIAKIIILLHLLLIISLVLSIFIPNKRFKEFCLALLIYILLQFVTNYGKCGLTELEYIFKKEKYQEGFLYRLIKPIITVPEKYFDNWLFLFHFIWILILAFQIFYK
jgi:hypothetical protein